ncbi:unnamed protein product, partial [Arabidopsis halleri]
MDLQHYLQRFVIVISNHRLSSKPSSFFVVTSISSQTVSKSNSPFGSSTLSFLYATHN